MPGANNDVIDLVVEKEKKKKIKMHTLQLVFLEVHNCFFDKSFSKN